MVDYNRDPLGLGVRLLTSIVGQETGSRMRHNMKTQPASSL